MSDILYFTNNPESPCAKAFRNREGILTFGITDEFTQYRDAAKAAIVDADGEDRQFMIKALLKEKLPFALCDLAGETPESLKRLCAAAKRRHIQVGWLGSWRFEWAMARLKEILCSGVLGTVQQLKLVKPEADGIFERLKDDDLINWLNSGIECALAYEDSQEEALKVVAVGSMGSATATIKASGVNEFAVALDDHTPRVITGPSTAWNAETGYIVMAIRNDAPWTMTGKIPG